MGATTRSVRSSVENGGCILSAEEPSRASPFPVLTCALIAVLVIVFGLELILGATPPTGALLSPSVRTLRSLGALSPTSIYAGGEWWRVLTTVFLHADLSHLFFNALVLLGAGYTLEVMIGRAWTFTLFLLGGICGSLMSLAVNSTDRVEVGASGAIMALLGVLLIVSFHFGGSDRLKLQLSSLRFLIPSLIPLGTQAGGEQIAYAAHFGGALGGGVMGLLVLGLWPKDVERPRLGGLLAAVASCGALGVLAAALPPLVKHHFSDVDALYGQAIADSKNNRYDSAVEALSKAIALDPRDASLYYGRGLAYRRTNDNDRAIDDFGQAIRLNGRDPFFFRERALAYEDKRDFDRAIEDYSEAIRLMSKQSSPPKSDLAGVFNDRGVAWKKKGDVERSIADYTEALRLDPKFALPYGNRGLAQVAKGNFADAIADYTQAIRLDPRKTSYVTNRAIAYRDQKQYDKAIEDFTQAIKLDDKNASAFRERALTYEYKGDLDRSVEDYSSAILLKPDYANAYNDRGVAYVTKGDTEKAIADYSAAIRINPRFALAYNNRGLVYRRLGDLDRAVADFEAAIEIDAGYRKARDNLQKARDALTRVKPPG